MLDLVAVREGGSVGDALAIAVRTAQHVESLGFKRYWLAEHHNMPGIASSATSRGKSASVSTRSRRRARMVAPSVPGARPSPKSMRPG